MPDAVEMPAPVRQSIFRFPSNHCFSYVQCSLIGSAMFIIISGDELQSVRHTFATFSGKQDDKEFGFTGRSPTECVLGDNLPACTRVGRNEVLP